MERVTSFNQDIYKHTNKIVSLFDWADDSNLFGSCGLDNQMLLYDIRLSRPILNKFLISPFPNCLKTFKNKIVFASKSLDTSIKIFDMRKLNKEYSKVLNTSFDSESKDYLIKEISKKFDHSDSISNFNKFQSKIKMKKRIKKD